MSAEVIAGISFASVGLFSLLWGIAKVKQSRATLEPVTVDQAIGELKTKVKINSDNHIKLSAKVVEIKTDVAETKTDVKAILSDTGAMKATVKNIMNKLNGG